MQERAERLITKIEATPRLAQLATNPLLLSLIVLVHSVKVELPEERLLLYRDCVEILTERWQRFKREEDVKKLEKELAQRENFAELSLTQKLALLCELAFAMQQQRQDEGSSALIAKKAACDLLAQKLPSLLGSSLSNEQPTMEKYSQQAEEWLAHIQEESGILVEQGLDDDGEPLIGFSHLTFQEYLTAVSLQERKNRQAILRTHLLQPAWQEVVLLSAALAHDPTSLIQAWLKAPTQPQGVLLAGKCLAERLQQKVKPSVERAVLIKLQEAFLQAVDQIIAEVGATIGMLTSDEMISFLRQQLNNPSLPMRLTATKALGHIRGESIDSLEQVRMDLLQMLGTSSETTLTIATREALAQVGDPRFLGPEPILVHVPPQPNIVPALMRTWKDLRYAPAWQVTTRVLDRLNILYRVIDYWLFTLWCILRKRRYYGYAFALGKYPVTNGEYQRFVKATDHPVPKSWKEGTYPRSKTAHPVVGIAKQDAKAYCKWLSQVTGQRYRLPTEWEWEWAASGFQGGRYPWGNQSEAQRCNTKEAGVVRTTPVGSYPTGESFCGASDMSGNVWEITSGLIILPAISRLLLIIIISIMIEAILTALLPITYITSIVIISLIIVSILSILLFTILAITSSILSEPLIGVSKGGGCKTYLDKSTCFERRNIGSVTNRGFRPLKQLD